MSDPQTILLIHRGIAAELEASHARRLLRACCGLVGGELPPRWARLLSRLAAARGVRPAVAGRPAACCAA